MIANAMQEKLEVIYERTNQVRETRISMLVNEYEFFKMRKDERIKPMFERFLAIIEDLHALRRNIPNHEDLENASNS